MWTTQGLGDTINRNIPTKIDTLSNITQTIQGSCGFHLLVKDSQNKIFGVGNNEGQLGIGTAQPILRPKELDSQYFPIWRECQVISRAKSARK